MRRALSGLCLAAILAAAACGGNAGATTAPATGGQAAQPAAAPSQAPPAAASAASSAAAQPAPTPARTATAAPAAIDPAKTTADAAASLSGASSDAGAKAIPAAGPAPAAAAPAPTPPIPGGSASAAAAAPAVASGAAVAPPAPEAPEAARRRAQIDWALKQDEIKNDRNGQWAVDAKASTSYNDAQGTAPFSAGQATGVPNVEALGNNGMAWAAKTPDGGIEWLELKYAKPVFATTVRVRESLGPGAIIKVELYDDQGAAHAVWSGIDTIKGLDYLVVEIPKTAYKTDRVRLTLATNTVSGWQEIDAVQLVGSDQAATTTAAAR